MVTLDQLKAERDRLLAGIAAASSWTAYWYLRNRMYKWEEEHYKANQLNNELYWVLESIRALEPQSGVDTLEPPVD